MLGKEVFFPLFFHFFFFWGGGGDTACLLSVGQASTQNLTRHSAHNYRLQTGTATGRLASAHPNVQNVPLEPLTFTLAAAAAAQYARVLGLGESSNQCAVCAIA